MESFKITREINGENVTIQLTEQEMWEISRIIRHETNLEEIRTGLDFYEEENGVALPATDEEIEEMAEKLGEALDWGGVNTAITEERDEIIRQFAEDCEMEGRLEGGDN